MDAYKPLLMFGMISALHACGGGDPTGSGGPPTAHACATVYYQEVLGSYFGQVTASLYKTKEQTELLNQCVWDVRMSIERINFNKDNDENYCFLRADYRSKLIAQVDNDTVKHDCIAINDVFNLTEGHTLDSDFWNAPVWPVDFGMNSGNTYTPESSTPYAYITPITARGMRVGVADFRKGTGGEIDFQFNISAEDSRLDGDLTKE